MILYPLLSLAYILVELVGAIPKYLCDVSCRALVSNYARKENHYKGSARKQFAGSQNKIMYLIPFKISSSTVPILNIIIVLSHLGLYDKGPFTLLTINYIVNLGTEKFLITGQKCLNLTAGIL